MSTPPAPWVSLEEMASLLRVDVKRLPLLIRLGYLHRWNGEEGKITLPARSGVKWIRAMLQPLPNRPLFTLSEVVELAQVCPPRGHCGWRNEGKVVVRRICAAYAIQIHVDEDWGELMSPDSFVQFLDALHGYREPMRFDRAALIEWMRGMKTGRRLRCNLPYTRLLDAEIARIIRLAEPERTVRAVALWECYRDAKMISSCLGEYKRATRKEMEKRETKLAGLMKKVTGIEIHAPAFPVPQPQPASPPPPLPTSEPR